MRAILRRILLAIKAFSPLSLPSLKLWLDADVGVQARGASSFVAASSQSLSKATPSAGLLGAVGGWWRGCWINLTDVDTRRVIQSTLSGNSGYELEVTAANVLKLSVGTGSGVVTVSHPTALSAATDYFVYFEYDGTNFGISLNGGALTQQALGASFSPGSATWRLGADTTPGNFWNGNISNFIVGSAPSFSAITSVLYNSGGGQDVRTLTVAQQVAWGVVEAWGLQESGTGTRAAAYASNTLANTNNVSGADGPFYEQALDSDPVARWLDQSGLGNHALQATPSRRPTYKTNVINGHAVIRQTTNGQGLATASLVVPSPATRFTVAGAVFLTSSATNRYWFRNGLQFVNGWSVGEDGNSPANRIVLIDSQANGTGTQAATGVWEIWTAIRTLNSVLASLLLNGITNGSTPTASVITPTDTTRIGQGTSSGSTWIGDIQQIVCCATDVPQSQRVQLERFLAKAVQVVM